LFANKQDLPNAMSAAELTDKLGLNQLRNRRVSDFFSQCRKTDYPHMKFSIVKDLLRIKLIGHEEQMMMQWNTNVIKNCIVMASVDA
jgi:hypothetical protein